MANKKKASLQLPYYTLAQYTAWDGILLPGQVSIVSDAIGDAVRTKIGDGVTNWTNLPYYNPASSSQTLLQTLGFGNTTSGRDMIITNDDKLFIGTDSTRYLYYDSNVIQSGLIMVNDNSGDYLNLKDSGGLRGEFDGDVDLTTSSGSELFVGKNYGVYLDADGLQNKYIDLTSVGMTLAHTGDLGINLGGKLALIGGLRLSSFTANKMLYLNGTNDIQSASFGVSDVELNSNKGAANGYVPLNASALIDSTYLPSYVDDILEYANLASFPITGETGKIYVAVDTGKQYRWTGSAYVAITNGFIASTNDVPEGLNLYFTNGRVDSRVAAYTGDVTLSGTTFSIGAGKVTNTMLAGSIAYSKLSLSGSIINADISASAAIVYSKLNLTGSILNADLVGGITTAKLASQNVSQFTNDSSYATTSAVTQRQSMFYACGVFNPTTSTTYFFGSNPVYAPVTATNQSRQIIISRGGTINKITLQASSGNAQSETGFNLIVKNVTTSTSVTFISSFGFSGGFYLGTGTGSLTVSANDKIEIQLTTPSSFTTAPTTLTLSGTISIE